jgi:hypothetical protein
MFSDISRSSVGVGTTAPASSGLEYGSFAADRNNSSSSLSALHDIVVRYLGGANMAASHEQGVPAYQHVVTRRMSEQAFSRVGGTHRALSCPL